LGDQPRARNLSPGGLWGEGWEVAEGAIGIADIGVVGEVGGEASAGAGNELIDVADGPELDDSIIANGETRLQDSGDIAPVVLKGGKPLTLSNLLTIQCSI
jgi:hypothetical protein